MALKLFRKLSSKTASGSTNNDGGTLFNQNGDYFEGCYQPDEEKLNHREEMKEGRLLLGQISHAIYC